MFLFNAIYIVLKQYNYNPVHFIRVCLNISIFVWAMWKFYSYLNDGLKEFVNIG